jgi:hypothetical protein
MEPSAPSEHSLMWREALSPSFCLLYIVNCIQYLLLDSQIL